MNNLSYYLSTYEQSLNESIINNDITLFNKCIDNVKLDSYYYHYKSHDPIIVLLKLPIQSKNFSYFLESLLDKGYGLNNCDVISDELCDVIVKKKYKPDMTIFIKILSYNLHIAKQIIENGYVLTDELFKINYGYPSILMYLKFLLENGADPYYNNANIIEYYLKQCRNSHNNPNNEVIQFFVENGIKVTKDIELNYMFQSFIHSKKLEQLETLNTKEIHEYIDTKIKNIHNELNEFIYNPEGIGATTTIVRNELKNLKNENQMLKNELTNLRESNQMLKNEIEKIYQILNSKI